MEKTFGQILKDLRRSKSISQRELATAIGLDFSYISKIENDRLPAPSAKTIEKISEVLEVPKEILLARSGKLSDELKEALTSSPEAVKFLSEVSALNLSVNDWNTLTKSLKRFR